MINPIGTINQPGGINLNLRYNRNKKQRSTEEDIAKFDERRELAKQEDIREEVGE